MEIIQALSNASDLLFYLKNMRSLIYLNKIYELNQFRWIIK